MAQSSVKYYKDEHMLIDPEEMKESDEDNTWHENQMTSKMVIKTKIEEYINSFSIHGLTRVFKGNRRESIFWSVILLLTTIFVAISIHNLIAEYHKYDYYTEMRDKLTKEHVFPSITICNQAKLRETRLSYCGKPSWEHGNRSIICDQENIKPTKAEFEEVEHGIWTNGAFNISNCQALATGQDCLNKSFFKATSFLEDACVTFNYDGHLQDAWAYMSLSQNRDNRDDLALTIHETNVNPLKSLVDSKVMLQPSREVEITYEKIVTKRLPSPYPSNCVADKGEDILPGKYARVGCLKSNLDIKIFKECGDCYDFDRQFIPEETKEKYSRQQSIAEAIGCIHRFNRMNMSVPDCPKPCDEIRYDTALVLFGGQQSDFDYSGDVGPIRYWLHVRSKIFDEHKEFEEKPIYTVSQLFSRIGAILVFCIGASIISFVEIIVYLVLLAVHKCI
ncbi:acid-sensing ion channel 4-A-like [Clytia hemisphaerica]|uniref:Uncharacterized protein n=1 Tax=Clytia hemisphaerica TaxID=252671 RepID=A0A7M5VEW9_9CNID